MLGTAAKSERSGVALGPPRNQRRDSKDHEEQRRKEQGGRELASAVVRLVPARVQTQGRYVTQQQEPLPGLQRNEHQSRHIQQGDVPEESDLVIFSGGKQQRGYEAAREREGRKNFRILRQGHRRSSRG